MKQVKWIGSSPTKQETENYFSNPFTKEYWGSAKFAKFLKTAIVVEADQTNKV